MVSCSRELFRRGACDETFGGERPVISICGKLEDFRCGLVPQASAEQGTFLPRPACGERSDCEAIRVRGYRTHRVLNSWRQPLTPTLSPQAGRGSNKT